MGDFGEPTFSALKEWIKPKKLRKVMNRMLVNMVKRINDQDCGPFQYCGASEDLKLDFIFCSWFFMNS
jgi:hypothetical protein